MNEEMKVRNAVINDLKTVVNIFNASIAVMNNNGIYQWDHIYPSEEILGNDILNN